MSLGLIRFLDTLTVIAVGLILLGDGHLVFSWVFIAWAVWVVWRQKP